MEEVEDKIEKQAFSTYRNIASIILTIITIVTLFWDYLVLIPIVAIILLGNLSMISLANTIFSLSIIVTLAIDVRALYLYIKYVLDSFSNKKKIRSIFLAIILISVIVLFRIQEGLMNSKFINLSYTILLVLGTTGIPVIRSILDLIQIWKQYKTDKSSKKKNRRKSILLTITIIIVLAVAQFFMGMISYALVKTAISEVKGYSFNEIFALKEKKVEKISSETNTISNPHISEIQRNLNIVFSPNSKLREDWITQTNNYNAGQTGASNYTFKNTIKLASDDKELSYMKIGFKLNDNLTNFIPIEDKEENYNRIDSYLIASSVMEITLKPGVKIENDYYTLRLNRYDEDFNINTNCVYIFEPVAEITYDSEGRQVIYIRYDKTYSLGELKNIELILGKE